MKTTKVFFTVSLGSLLLSSVACFGQSGDSASRIYSNATYNTTPAFTKGTNVINLGIGLGGDYSYFGPGYIQIPDFVVSYENGTFGNVGPGTISLGGLLAFTGTSYTYFNEPTGTTYTDRWMYSILGFRSAYHLNVPSCPRFDPYAGLMLAYYYVGYSHTGSDAPYTYYYSSAYPSYLSPSVFIGARYYLSNTVGLWAELGYGYSNLAIGVSLKM